MLSNNTIEELCRKLRPILGEQIERVYMKYSVSTDRDERLEIEKLVHALYHKHLGKSLLSDEIMLEPPQKEEIEADYGLGTVVYVDKDICTFGLREKDWIRHMCVTGMSGSGKTTFAYTILGSMIVNEKPFLVFDWKRSFRPFLKVSEKTMVYIIGNENVKNFFRTNINIPPPGVGPKQWISIVADLLSEAYQTSFGVHKVITETMHDAYTDFKVYEGSNNYPNWYQIKDRLEEKANRYEDKRSSREYEWVTSALRIAHELTFGSFGEVINYKGRGMIDLSELLNHQVIFELDGLSNAEKKFFTSYILTYIFKEKKSNPNNLTSQFKHLILVDEAHNIFLKDRPNFMSESITETIFREIREFGVSLVCLDQHISKLSDVVSGNSACNIAFQQQLPDDIRAVSSLMQLNEPDQRKYFTMLPVGYAVVKLAERYNNPFLMKALYIDTKKFQVDDSTIETEMYNRVKLILKSDVTTGISEDKYSEYYETEKSINNNNIINNSNNNIKSEINDDSSDEFDLHNEPNFNEYYTKKDEYSKTREPVVNHLQKDLVLFISSLIDKGFDIKNIRVALREKNYKLTDINVAISNIDYDRYIKAKQNELLNKNSYSLLKDLTKEQIDALERISQNTYTVTGLYSSLQISSRKGNDLKNSLLSLGLIDVIEERSNMGMRKKLLLSPKGFELMEKAGIPII